MTFIIALILLVLCPIFGNSLAAYGADALRNLLRKMNRGAK